jgi:dipeptidyl aminopeptidase/acylaminoacyl peptidase
MRKKILIGSGVGFLIALVVYSGLSTVIYLQLATVEAECAAHPEEAAFTPGAFTRIVDGEVTEFDTTPYLMSSFEQVSFPSRDPDIMISAWYVEAQGVDDPSDEPAVIVVHGFNDCRQRTLPLTAGGMLNKHGFNVLIIDLQEHGASTIDDRRMTAGSREYLDILGAWDWLVEEKEMPEEKIGVVGFSLGAASSMIAMAEEPRIAAVWEDSGFGALDKILQSELDRIGLPRFFASGALTMGRVISGDNLMEFEPLEEVTELDGRPIFIVHGTADERVALETAIDLADVVNANGGDVTPWITDGSAHIESAFDYPDEYEEKLVDFFNRSLR